MSTRGPRKAWNGGSIEAAMEAARERQKVIVGQGASICDECGGDGGTIHGICAVCHGQGVILPFGGLRHPSQIGALNRVAHAARAVVEMLPHGPDRYELEV